MNHPEEAAAGFRDDFQRLHEEIAKVIVGAQPVIDGVLTCLFASGHCLLEGVPGLGKTLLVRTLSQALDLQFSRIQFTPDLMPADIIGTNIVVEDESGNREFRFRQGPIFANIILADEINRATPKTQSALLEAMQEHTVSVARTSHRLEEPFFVMATQNPIEMEGTYTLPEAQLDRFFFKLLVTFPGGDDLAMILDRTTQREMPRGEKVMDAARLTHWAGLVRDVLCGAFLRDHSDVDDEPAPIVRANYLFRAVPVAAGEHVVAMRFQPVSLRSGLLVTAAAVVVLLILVLAGLLRRRARSAA